jgi:ribosomal subunit interface protein
MQVPLQITFRGMSPSDALAQVVRDRAARLERFHERITRCHVVVDVPHQHQRKGRHYSVRLDITTPTGEVAVSREPPLDASHEDIHAVVRDAFDAAARQLEDDLRRARGDVKSREPPDRGKVVRLFRDDGYGFIATPDGLEVYFHENSVASGNFARLHIGSEVQFTFASDEHVKGPRATTVQLMHPSRD